MPRWTKTLRERLESNYRVLPSGCWEWTASMGVHGYGQISVNGRPMSASRASYIAFKGDIPDGLDVCHKCDYRPCMNPDHLFVGTRKVNIQDAATKGRLPRGEKRPNSKLNKEDVLMIRSLCAINVPMRKIAEIFNVHCVTIHGVKHGRLWSHIPKLVLEEV